MDTNRYFSDETPEEKPLIDPLSPLLVKADSDTAFIKEVVANQQKLIDGIIEEGKTDDELYPEILKSIRKIQEEFRRLDAEKNRIEKNRYSRQAKIERHKRDMDRVNTILIEREELEAKRREAAEKVERLKAYALEQNFEWTKYALKHQWEGALTLASFGSALLGDGTGTGKTLTSIMYCDMLPVGDRIGAKKVVAFVPNDLVTNYALEVQQWAPHRKNVIPLSGAKPGMREMVRTFFNELDEFFLIVNYESAWRDSEWLTTLTDIDAVVIDEAHNMKNIKGNTYDAVKNMQSENFLPMTATFILNAADDIFSSLSLIAPKTFNDLWAFRRTYLEQDMYTGKWGFRPGGEKALIDSMGGRIVKRTLEDTGVKLPTQHIRELLIPQEDVSAQQREVMRQLKDYASLSIPDVGEMNVSAMIALITRERQAATYPAGIEAKVTEAMAEQNPGLPPVGTVLFKVPDTVPSVKIDIATERIVAATKGGKRTVVFSQFKTALVGLEKKLTEAGIRVARFDGDTKQQERLKIKKDFLRRKDGNNEDYHYDVVLANYKTGGVGLTFTAATYMIQLDEEWNPGKNQQAHARIHRIGQTEETLVEVFRVEKSVDKWMQTLNETKGSIIDGFEGATLNIKSEFQEYFATNKEVTAEEVIEELEEAVIDEPEADEETKEETEINLDFLDDFMANN